MLALYLHLFRCEPIILLIPGLVRKSFGGTQSLTYCFMTRTSDTWGLLLFPVCGTAVIALGCMFHTIYMLYQTSRANKTSNKKGSSLLRHIRAILFILQFAIIFIFVIAFNGSNYFKLDAFASSGATYFRCMLGKKFSNGKRA